MLRGKIIIDLERRFGARLENEKLFECLGAYDLEFDLSLSKFFYLLPKDYRVLTLLPLPSCFSIRPGFRVACGHTVICRHLEGNMGKRRFPLRHSYF